MVPSELSGAIIGRGGDNLRRVREALGVRVDVEKAPVANAAGAQERAVTFSGAFSAIGRALALSLGAAPAPGPAPGQLVAYAGLAGGPPQQFATMPLQGWMPSPGVCGAPTLTGRPEDSQVRPLSDDPEQVQLHFVIPGKLTGAIVGKEGASIKELASQSGCSMSVTNRSNSSDRRIICTGSYQQCASGQRMLYQQLMSAASTASIDVSVVTVIFWVPNDVSGAVIGKGGASLAQIREQTGVKLLFPKEEVQRQRPCSITGGMQNILQAEGMIFDLVHTELIKVGPAKRVALASLNGDVKRPGPQPGGEIGQTKLLVPARTAGAVIGKRGFGLCRIREECSVKIDMLQQAQAPQWPEDRVVVLQGPGENCLAALKAVLMAAFQMDESNAILKMLVTGGEAGAIIGKQGSRLKALREQSGISTQVEKNDIFGERLVAASGPLASVLQLAQLIMNILRDNKAPGSVSPLQVQAL